MNRKVVIAKPETTIKEASEVMDKLHIGSLIVVEGGKIIGIVTGSDILKAVSESRNLDTENIKTIMSKEVKIIDPDKKIEDAVDIMVENKIKRLPVVENEKLVGIITASDIIVVEPKLIESIANLLSIKLPGYRGG
jgi:CBS domain-containing protein